MPMILKNIFFYFPSSNNIIHLQCSRTSIRIINCFSLDFCTEFISYARGIFESNIEDISSEMPLESDARAYEFLASCNNDVELAKFFLHSTLSFGKGNDYISQ